MLHGARSIEQTCPARIRRVLERQPSRSERDAGLDAWNEFVFELSSVIALFPTIDDDCVVSALCCCVPCLAGYRRRYVSRHIQASVEKVLRRHHASFAPYGIYLHFRERAVDNMACGCYAMRFVFPSVVVEYDPTAGKDRM